MVEGMETYDFDKIEAMAEEIVNNICQLELTNKREIQVICQH